LGEEKILILRQIDREVKINPIHFHPFYFPSMILI
jgi:hypothetical protein